MSPQDTPDDAAKDVLGGAEAEPDNDSVASKLSKELSNWRRRRSTSRPKRADARRNYDKLVTAARETFADDWKSGCV